MTETDETRRIAVACQGGGSHTAFTAGVLDRLLAETDPAYEIAALTGTSGGAICAFLAWYGLASARVDGKSDATGRRRGRNLLEAVWGDIEASDPFVAAANRMGVWWARARDNGAPLPSVSPYESAAAGWTEEYLRTALERAVPPESLSRVVDAQRKTGVGPTLHVGAVDVTRGSFRTFTERDVTIDAVLASAAIPTVFRAATVDDEGEPRQYWDGLFSQNPPVRDLLAGVPEERKPEEIWLVRINPQRRAEVPTTLEAIGDRRNELGGNLSVGQELAFIRRVNEWVAEGSLPSTYRRIAVRTIGLDEERLVRPRSLTTASKLDCRPVFVAELTAAGRTAAERFLDVERTRRLVRGTVESTWTRSPTAGVYLADDFALHAVGTTESRGPAAYEEYVDRFHEALDEFSFRVESTVAEDDRVALVWVVGGRHVRRLLGADPSGEHVSIRGVQIARVASEDDEATVVETWIAVDDSELTRGRDTEAPGDVPVLTTASTPVVADLRSAEEGRGVGIDHAERVWGAAETDAARRVARRVVAADHVFGRDREDLKGREAYLTLVESYRDAFPDLRVCVRDVVAEGDHVVVRAAMTGTHEGPFEGIDPTGRRVEAHWTFVHHLADGRIASTGMVDNHGWLIEQLSATPLSGSHASDPTVS